VLAVLRRAGNVSYVGARCFVDSGQCELYWCWLRFGQQVMRVVFVPAAVWKARNGRGPDCDLGRGQCR
jgi:hypothetical protein